MATPETVDDTPRTTGRRPWSGAARAVVLLVALGVVLWLATPHLSASAPQVEAELTVPAGGAADASAGTATTTVELTSTGLVPVTLVAPAGPLQVSGPVPSTVVEIGFTDQDGRRAGSVVIPPRGRATVTLVLHAPACADAAGGSTTVLESFGVQTSVGPLSRDVRLPAGLSVTVVTEDGSPLPRCEG